MTIHIQMLYEVAKHARELADAMQAIADDCAEQIAMRKAAEKTDEAMLDEVFGSMQPNPSGGMTLFEGSTPFDEKTDAVPASSVAPEKPSLTLV